MSLPKEIYLDSLSQMDLSPLPESAIQFLYEYLTYPSATVKVSVLLNEARRLNDANKYNEDYKESIKYKGSCTTVSYKTICIRGTSVFVLGFLAMFLTEQITSEQEIQSLCSVLLGGAAFLYGIYCCIID